MDKQKSIWTAPWNYKESSIISIAVLFIGFLLEFATKGAGTKNLLLYPANIYFAAGLTGIIIVIGTLRNNYYLFDWLGSKQAAISSIGVLLFVSLLMGIIKQTDENDYLLIHKLGLSHILTSWPYLLANLFLLICLGTTIIKNLAAFQLKKAGFMISHVGLWIVVFGANFGSSQLQRLNIELNEGETTNLAITVDGEKHLKLPFAIKLNDFILENYTPKLAILSHKTTEPTSFNGLSTIEIDTSEIFDLGPWKVEALKYISTSAKAGSKYYFVNELGAAPSVLINVTDSVGNVKHGWVSCGSFNRPFESLKLNNELSIVMLLPEPKLFTSQIEIIRESSLPITYDLQVNKPITIEGWKIYQKSYNSELGIWSGTSVIEIIKDPWIHIVYTGIFFMIGGAIYMFWAGSVRKKHLN